MFGSCVLIFVFTLCVAVVQVSSEEEKHEQAVFSCAAISTKPYG